jgi:CheY-like chemotaxis protein
MNLYIILIDDDPISCALYRAITAKMGIASRLLTFYDGKEALHSFRTNFLPSDRYIIFLDIDMPVMSGWEFLEAVDTKQYSSSIKVIIITSLVEQADRERAAKHKVVAGLFQKPLEQESIEVIKKVCSSCWDKE